MITVKLQMRSLHSYCPFILAACVFVGGVLAQGFFNVSRGGGRMGYTAGIQQVLTAVFRDVGGVSVSLALS